MFITFWYNIFIQLKKKKNLVNHLSISQLSVKSVDKNRFAIMEQPVLMRAMRIYNVCNASTYRVESSQPASLRWLCKY